MMTDDEQDFFNKSIGKLEKEIIALKKEYQAECNRADELEDSLQTSWQNERKLKELLKECKEILEVLKCGSINDLTASRPHARNLLTKINAAIGESEE